MTEKFVKALTKLDPTQIAGLAISLKIGLRDDNGEPKSAEVVISDLIHKFESLRRNQQKNLIKFLK